MIAARVLFFLLCLSMVNSNDNSQKSITDIENILVGHSVRTERPTGCTVIICNTTCIGAVDVRGSAPGTRETDLLDPLNIVEHVNAITLCGGSAFGLDAVAGVVKCLDEKQLGFPTLTRRVPIVPAAVLYDLYTKNDALIVPDADIGYSACISANNSNFLEGNVGAGAGALIGKVFGVQRAMKGGLGTTSLTVFDSKTNASVTVGALVAVNAVGDIYKNGQLFAGARTVDGKNLVNTVEFLLKNGPSSVKSSFPGTATTLACIATNAKLTKAQAKKVSQMAHDGFARAINPVHTMNDGDIIFTLATGTSSVSDVNLIGMIAARVVEQAIVQAIEKATSSSVFPNINDFRANSSSSEQTNLLIILFLTFCFFLNSLF